MGTFSVGFRARLEDLQGYVVIVQLVVTQSDVDLAVLGGWLGSKDKLG